MPGPPRRRILRSLLALALLCAAVAAIAQLAGLSGRDGGAGTKLVFDGGYERWLVQAPGRSGARLQHATAKLGGGKPGRELAGDWYEVRLGDEVAAADAESAFGAVGATAIEPVLPRRAYAEPSSHDDAAPAIAPRSTPDAIDDPPAAGAPGDTGLRAGPVGAPRIGEQWALAQASDEDLDAPEAWGASTGGGAVVAVIDTGVDASHPDLAGRVLEGRDFSGAGTPATVDRVGHGTQVASIIAGNGTAGMAGIAPDARILPLKVFRDSEGGFSMAGYLSAIRYAADQGVDVINISLGCGGTTSCFSQAELDALTYATERGVLVVAAAGNAANDNDAPATPDFPSGYELPGVLAVTSSTRSGEWATWSSFGAQSVDIAAPGEGILVASAGGSYRSVTGTSFSAPYAAGVAALVAAADPVLDPAGIRARMMATVTPDPSLAQRTSSGGTLNADAALRAPDAAAVGGGGAPAVDAMLLSPHAGAVVGTPPVLSWSLPAGWTTQRVLLAQGAAKFDRSVAASSRALAHPAPAWRSGAYRWQVVARDPAGGLHTTPARTYRIAPRLGAWVTSGKVRPGGRAVRLRVGYAASEPSATVRVVVSSGGRVVHGGKSFAHTSHARGSGSPRRGWFAYDANLSRTLRVGTPITVSVRVTAGGATLTRSFRAKVA